MIVKAVVFKCEFKQQLYMFYYQVHMGMCLKETSMELKNIFVYLSGYILECLCCAMLFKNAKEANVIQLPKEDNFQTNK